MPPTPAAQYPPVAAFSVDSVLSLPEAAQIAGVSVWTLKRRSRDGEITILRLSTRRVGIRTSELRRWLDTREVRA